MADNSNENDRFQSIADSGCKVNRLGRVYNISRVISVETYTCVIEKYIDLQIASVGCEVPISHVALASKVDWKTAKKAILCHESDVLILASSYNVWYFFGCNS